MTYRSQHTFVLRNRSTTTKETDQKDKAADTDENIGGCVKCPVNFHVQQVGQLLQVLTHPYPYTYSQDTCARDLGRKMGIQNFYLFKMIYWVKQNVNSKPTCLYCVPLPMSRLSWILDCSTNQIVVSLVLCAKVSVRVE